MGDFDPEEGVAGASGGGPEQAGCSGASLESYQVTSELPSQRMGHVAVALSDGRVLVWAGCNEEDGHYWPPDQVLVSESRSSSVWTVVTTRGQTPPPTSGAAAAVIDNVLYVFGGTVVSATGLEDSSNALFALDVSEWRWKRVCPSGDTPPVPCDKAAAFAHNNSKGWNDQLVAFDVRSSQWMWPWSSGTRPSPRAAHAVAVAKDRAFVFGGRTHEHRANDLHCLQLDTISWSKIQNDSQIEDKLRPSGRSWHSLTLLSDGDTALLLGGLNCDGAPASDCWTLGLSTIEWTQRAEASPSCVWHAAVNVGDGSVWAIGGVQSNPLDMFVPRSHPRDVIKIKLGE